MEPQSESGSAQPGGRGGQLGRGRRKRWGEREGRGRAGSQASLASDLSSATFEHGDSEHGSSCLCVLSGNVVLRTLQALGVGGCFNEIMCA